MTPKKVKEQKCFSPSEAADHFGVATKTIYNWIAGGVLPASKIRGHIYIRLGNIERILNESLIKPGKKKE